VTVNHPVAAMLLFPLGLTAKCVLLLPVTLALYAVIIPVLIIVGTVRLCRRRAR
jgi:hypothetical protein